MTPTSVNQELLQAAVAAMPADELAAVRRDAAARFARSGFPTIGEEDWKYTSLSAAAEISNDWLDAVASGREMAIPDKAPETIEAIREQLDAHWILIHDGIVDEASLDALSLPGLEISRISNVSIEDDAAPMSLFNSALLRDGLRIRAGKGATTDKPIGLLLVDSPSNAVAQSRVVVDADESSHLRIVTCELSAGPGSQFTNALVDVALARGARLDHVRIQDRDGEHVGVNRFRTKLGHDAVYRHNSFDLGGALSRNDVIADIAGPGASVELNGLYLATGDQHIDNHTSILHRVGPATSVEEYRGILSGKSQCVFNGKVVVSPGADGTDSSQSNHNLLLSDRAEIDTKPELEIYADDVKCAHGATVGQLDKTALFYLRTRGLDLDAARRILTRAFAAGTLSALAIDECHDMLAALLDKRLAILVDQDQ